MSRSLKESARLANVGGDIRYGQKIKAQESYAEKLISSLTDKAQSDAEGNKLGQNVMDFAKFAVNFIPGWGQLASAGLSAVDLGFDVKRAKSLKSKLSKEQLNKIKGSKFEDYVNENVGALDSQLKGVGKGQIKSSLLSNLLNIGMSLGSIPGADKVPAKAGGNVVKETVGGAADDVAKDVVTKAIEEAPKKTIPGVDPYYPMHDFEGFNPSLKDAHEFITDATSRSEKIAGNAFSGSPDNLTSVTPGTKDSLLDLLEGKDWFTALSDTVPGMSSAVGLSKYKIGDTGVTLGSAYAPTSSILNRLMTDYGETTSPSAPRYQRKSLRGRIV